MKSEMSARVGTAASCELADQITEIARKLADCAQQLKCGDTAPHREHLRHYAAEVYLLAERLDFIVDVEDTAKAQAKGG